MSELALMAMKLILLLSSLLWITKGKSRDINLSKMNKPEFPKLVFLKLKIKFSDQCPMLPVGPYE